MNDWWNDPPDEPDCPEYPECEDGVLEWDDELKLLVCSNCKYQQEIPPDVDPPEDPEIDAPPQGCRDCGKTTDCVYCSECAAKRKCAHGLPLTGGCHDCDADSDRAYDAWREGQCR